MKKDWTYKKLGDIATFSRGLTYAKEDVADLSSKKVLRSNNIDLASHTLNFDDIACLNEGFIIPADKMLRKGDIFICMSNGSTQHLGKVAFIENDIDYAFGGFMGAIHPNSIETNPKFVYYALLSKEYRRFLASILNGININNLKWSELLKFTLPVPDELDEQSQIVSELDLLQSIIDKQKAQLKELDNLAQAVFYDMFGDPVENEKGWDVKKLGTFCSKIGSGATPRGGNESYKTEGISLIRSLNVHNNEFVYKDLAFIDEEQARALSNVDVQPNDILLNITGASVARCCVVPDYLLPARVNQHVCIIRPINDVEVYFLSRLLTNAQYQAFLIDLARGKAATREALPKNIVEGLPIIIPPLSLQHSFAAKIESIEKQKAAINKSIEESQKLFDYTMDKYFG